MIRFLVLLLLPVLAQADTLRIATFNTELSQDGPGLLLQKIRRDDPKVLAVLETISKVQPDIVALQSIDWDLDQAALIELVKRLEQTGISYPYQFAAQPNSGLPTNMDLDGDGRVSGPGDAQGWGRFTGQGGLAILSRHPIRTADALNFSQMLWQELPGATMPRHNDQPFPSQQAQNIQRLSSTGHWVVPIDTPLGQISILTFHAAPPVFDGPEDRNGLRNRDEIRFWSLFLDGALGPAPRERFVIAGDANLDPGRGDGRKEAIRDLLAHPRVQDPVPTDQVGSETTVSWKGVGELRVDYVLPSIDWLVVGSGTRGTPDGGSRHRLVWVDLMLP